MKTFSKRSAGRHHLKLAPLQVKRKDVSIKRLDFRCASCMDGQGPDCVEWDGSHDHIGRAAANDADMQAGFSGRVDELRDLHVDVVDNRYLVGGSFSAAANPESVAGGIECQNVAPWRHLHQSVNLLKAKSIWGEINEVFVFLFGGDTPGSTGIYSLRTFSLENVPRETVIAFESMDDAVRYAGLLSSTMNHVPTVHGITPEQLAEFCMESGYSCQLEAPGSPLVPPNFNVRVTDWERSLRLRSGEYCVLPAQPGENTDSSDSDWEYLEPHQYEDPGESLTPTLDAMVKYYYELAEAVLPPPDPNAQQGADYDRSGEIELMRHSLERIWG